MEDGKSRLQQTQDEVEEVKLIMVDNLNKASERSEKLGDLEVRAEDLEQKSKAFEKTAVKVRQKKQCENKKMKYVFIGVGMAAAAIILGLIIFALV